MSVHLIHSDIDGVCACLFETQCPSICYTLILRVYVPVFETQCPSICYTLILRVYVREFETQCPSICYTLILRVYVREFNNNNNNNNQYIYKQRQSHAMSQRRWLATAVIFRPSDVSLGFAGT